MRIIIALRLLVRYYHKIIPTYIMATLLMLVATHVLPLFGALLMLPVTLGVAYVMVYEVSTIREREFFPLFIGFKRHEYGRNVWYLFLRQLVQYVPLIIGFFLTVVFAGYLPIIQVDVHFMVIGLNFFIFAIPSAIIALLVSMVPYILSDPLYNVVKANPLKTSALLLRGNYLRLIVIRLIFMPFILWSSSGLIVTLFSYYSRIFGGSGVSPTITTTWLFSAPILFLFFTPWYQMTHAVLYGQIRHKLRDLI